MLDDTLVYRRGSDKFLVVVNASNDDKDRTWFESVRDGMVEIDNARPWARTYGYEAEIRDLRDPKAGDDMRVDIALQGPKSRDILLAMGVDEETRQKIIGLKRTELCDAVIGDFDLIVSRTGYTGEKMAFELFVHPERAVDFWNAVLKAGEPFGLKPVGLGARDSLRTEAGLPLYGHEMGLGSGKFGHRDLGVAEGGFGSYVKPYKPWFIGRDAYVTREGERKGVVVRFRFDEPARPHGAPWRPGGQWRRTAHRLGDLLRHRQRALPDGSGVSGEWIYKSRYTNWHPPGRGDGSTRDGGEGGESVSEDEVIGN